MSRSPRAAPAVRIEVLNRSRGRLPGRRLLERAAGLALAGLAGRRRLSTTLVCVGQREMTELNARFHRRRQPTDVLSFDYGDRKWGAGDRRRLGRRSRTPSPEPRTPLLVGEVVICREVAVREARARALPVAGELLLYAVHGWLHLAGYGDGTAHRRRRMVAAERRILSKLGFERDASPTADRYPALGDICRRRGYRSRTGSSSRPRAD
jgi:probable rRNA maturation factor